MKQIKTKITISKPTSAMGGKIKIKIEDSNSGNIIIETTMSLEYFADAITGAGMIESISKLYDTSNVGKKRETMTFYVDKKIFEGTFDKNEMKKRLNKHLIIENKEFMNLLGKGWMMHDDGLKSHQPRDQHKILLKRFVEVGEEE